MMRTLLSRFALAVMALIIVACSRGGVQGSAHVIDQQAKIITPAHPASTVWVKDFQMDLSNFQPDQGGRLNSSLITALKEFKDGDAQTRANALINDMAESLVDDLRKAGFSAQRLSATAARPPSGWLVEGVFALVDEGNRKQRAVMGMGMGASTVEVDVTVSDLQSRQGPFAFFSTVSDPAHKPPSPNPYAMAARFVMEKNSAGHDVAHDSEQIAKELSEIQKKAVSDSR